MAKIFKLTGIVLGLLLLLAVVATISLVTLVNPNSFKPTITNYVMKSTGRQLHLDGDLAWTFFPYLGIKVSHVVLDNPADFPPTVFAEIDHATIGIKLLPLFHFKIEASGIALSGLKLTLVKSAAGKINWQDLQNKSDNYTMSTDKQEGALLSKAFLGLAIAKIDISNANITWLDEQAKQYFVISDLELHAKNLSLVHSFPIVTAFRFSESPNTSSHVAISSDVVLNPQQYLYQLTDFKVIATFTRDGKTVKQTTTGDVTADLRAQTLNFKNVAETIANLTIIGAMNVRDLSSSPAITGHFKVKPFDLKNWLQTIGQDVPSLQVSQDLRGEFDFSFTQPQLSSANSFAGLTLQGNFKISKLQLTKLKIQNVNLQANLKNSILEIAPISADLYQGSLQSKAEVNLTSPIPQIAFQAQLSDIQSQPLLQDLNGTHSKLSMAGVANVDLRVTTTGLDIEAVKRNLNGISYVSFNNGSLIGFDIGYLIDSTYAAVTGHVAPTNNSNQTTFGNLTASAVIQNGVINNNNLVIDSPRFDAKGQGVINLMNQQINYRLQTTVKKQFQEKVKNVMDLKNLLIPIVITGSLANPVIRLDTQTLVKSTVSQKMKNVKTQMQEKIKDNISSQAGALLQNLLTQ